MTTKGKLVFIVFYALAVYGLILTVSGFLNTSAIKSTQQPQFVPRETICKNMGGTYQENTIANYGTFWLCTGGVDVVKFGAYKTPAIKSTQNWTPETYCQTHDCAVSKVPLEIK